MARPNLEILMRWVRFLLILFVALALTLSLISCTGYQFNFTCNDYNHELTLEENVKNLKKCKDGEMFQWTKSF